MLENQHLRHPDGRLRILRGLERITGFGIAITDTRGSEDVPVENAVLATHIRVSPIIPEILSA